MEYKAGTIVWTDLTVPDAEQLREFYAQVAGWKPEGLSMGDYDDYMMKDAEGNPVAGVCHARGVNAALPPQWLVYVAVENVEESVRRCKELGGKTIDGPRDMGGKQFCAVQDPAGAVIGLIEV